MFYKKTQFRVANEKVEEKGLGEDDGSEPSALFDKYTVRNILYTENIRSKTTLLKYTFEESGLGEDDGSEPSVPILVNGIAHPVLRSPNTKHSTYSM